MAGDTKTTQTATRKKDSKLVSFCKGLKSEFRKIIWPDRDTLLKELLAVLVISFLVGAIIALLDFGFQNLIDFLTQLKIGS